MASIAESCIREATEDLMNLFHSAYQQYIDYITEERDAALDQISKAKAEAQQAKEEALRLQQESDRIREEMQRWKREADETRRQLANTGAKLSLTIVPLGDPGTSGSKPKPDDNRTPPPPSASLVSRLQ